MRLTNKLIRDASIFLILISMPIFYIAFNYSYNASLQNRDMIVKRHLISFKNTLSEAIWNGDLPYIRQIVNTLGNIEGVSHVVLFDDKMSKMQESSSRNKVDYNLDSKLYQDLHDDIKTFSDDKNQTRSLILLLTKKTNLGTERLGIIKITIHSDDLVKNARINSWSIIAAVLFIMLFFFALQYLYLRKFLIKPLSDLEEAIGEMNTSGDIKLQEDKNHIFEIASLTKTFNKMGEELKESAGIISNQQIQMINVSKMSALGEMAAGVAHEINNPLMITTGFLERIQKVIQTDPQKYAEISLHTEKAIKGTIRVAKIVKALRSFARNGSNDPMQEVEAEKIISETLELCFERFKHGEIKLEITKTVNERIICRESQISQVLLNLLNNAYDAVTDLKSTEKWVQVEIANSAHNNKIMFYITDCGPGIPKDIAAKMLEPFFTTKDTGKGTGLGLSISVGIIEEHGGKLYLDHDHPNTRFVIELPKSA